MEISYAKNINYSSNDKLIFICYRRISTEKGIRLFKTYVIGSSAVMSDSLKNSTNATRLGGKDRFETNKKIINHFYKSPTEFYLSNHAVLVDALTVSPIAKNTPVVLVKKGSDKSILKGATNYISFL